MTTSIIGYVIMTFALIGLLGYTTLVGNAYMVAQTGPVAYVELGSIAYAVQDEMVVVGQAISSMRGQSQCVAVCQIIGTISVPITVAQRAYTITASGTSLVLEAAGVKRTFTLATMSGVVWAGVFKSGVNFLRVIGTYDPGTGTVTVAISD